MDFDLILKNRRAINHFDPERDVDDETLKTILEQAVKAPSSTTCNLGSWLSSVTQKRKPRSESWPLISPR